MSQALDKAVEVLKLKNKEALAEVSAILVDEYLAEVVAASETPIDDVVYAASKETIKKILADLIAKI